MRSRMLFLVISLTLFTFCSCTRKLPSVESGEALVRANSTAAPSLGVHCTLPDEYHDQAPSLGVHRTLPDEYHGQAPALGVHRPVSCISPGLDIDDILVQAFLYGGLALVAVILASISWVFYRHAQAQNAMKGGLIGYARLSETRLRSRRGKFSSYFPC